MYNSIIAEALVEGKVNSRILRGLLFPFPIFGQKYEVVVNYDAALEKLIGDGHYDAKGSYNTRGSTDKSNIFPTERTGQESIIIKLVRFRRFASISDALEQLDYRGLRPIEFKELLILGSKYPLIQLKKDIVALGSKRVGLTDQEVKEFIDEGYDKHRVQKCRSSWYRYPSLSKAAEGRTLSITFPWMAWLEDWYVAYTPK